MMARFIYRFDDLCPTMNWRAWDRIERVVDQTDSCIIASIVPYNRDPELILDLPNPRFWERAREWRDKGFVTGLQGYQHLPKTTGASGVPLHGAGEFLGDDYKTRSKTLTWVFRYSLPIRYPQTYG
jgi:hypothetical protein